MSSPLKKPNISYVPQVGASIPVEDIPIGEAGDDLSTSTVIDAIDSLISEVKEGINTIEFAMGDFAITDKNGILSSATSRVLGLEKSPVSITYPVYVALGTVSTGESIRKVYEEKAYSVWGNASLALIDALHSIAGEAVRARNHIINAKDQSIVESISEWTGAARGFVVDAISVGTSSVSDDIIAEVASYEGKAPDIQKSAIIGAAVLQGETLSNLARLKNLYSTNVYDGMVDIAPTQVSMSSGVVGAMINRHIDVANSVSQDMSQDFAFRVEAFTETTDSLLKAVSQLRITQMVNSELVNIGGVQESSSSEVYSTNPDMSFVYDEFAADYSTEDNTPLSLAVILKIVESEINPLIPIIPETDTWHIKSIHDSLGIDAATVDGKAYSDLVTDFSASGHTHSSSDTHISEWAQIETDTRFTTGFVSRSDSTISISDSTHIFTISPVSTSFSIYSAGTRITKTVAQTVDVPTVTNQLNFIYFNSAGVLSISDSPWDVDSNNILVATARWNGSAYDLADERHGAGRNNLWHKWAHETIGTRYGSGLDGSFTATTFSISSGTIYDEDVKSTIGTQTVCRLFYRHTGATAMTFQSAVSTTPYMLNGSKMRYDNNGTLADVSNNKYANMYVYGTNSTVPIAVVIGQGFNNSASAAASESLPLIPTTTAEWKLLYVVCFKQLASSVTLDNVRDLRYTSTGPAIVISANTSTPQLPTGSLLPFAGVISGGSSVLPVGYLGCDGSAVSRTTYSGLFSVIETSYGVGDNSTTFNLPDLRGRVPIGEDGSAARMAANDALGNSGGAEDAIVVSHTHNVGYITGGNPTDYLGGSTATYGIASPYSTRSGELDMLEATGVSGAGKNLQPYQIVNYIIKT